MFTWICPMCGRECPPSYTECPDCSAKGKPAEPVAATVAAPPPPPVPTPAAPQYVPQAEPPRGGMWNPPPPVPEAPPPPAQGVDLRSYARPLPPPEPVAPNHPPAWLVTLGVAIAIIIVGGAFFYWLGSRHSAAETATPIQLETPSTTAAAAAGGEHPYKKHLELVGYRIYEDAARKPQLKFLIVNHSSAELAPVNMRVTVETTKSNAGDPPVAVLQFTTPKLAAYGSQEMTAPLNTKLRAYEIPDWQFLRLQPEITSK